MKRFYILMFLILAAFLGSTAIADNTLVLPAGLKTVEAEAFAEDTELQEMILPQGIERIEARAFAGGSITTIDSTASL